MGDVAGWIAIGLFGGMAAGQLGWAIPHADKAGKNIWRSGLFSRNVLRLNSEHMLGALLGLVFVVLDSLHYGTIGAALATALFSLELVLMLLIDLRHRLVYPLPVLVATLSGLALNPLTGLASVWSSLLAMVIAAAAFVLLWLVGRVVMRVNALGAGDIYLAGMIGAMVGLTHLATALIWGIVLSGVLAVVMLVSRRSGKSDYLPYGPGLCLGALLILALH